MFKLEERKASIKAVKSKLKVSILDDQEISEINQNTRVVLEEVGVTFPSDRALKLFADVGANVDFDKQRIALSIKQTQQAPGGGKGKPGEEDQPPAERALKSSSKPLKGGTDRPSGGEHFGLKW